MSLNLNNYPNLYNLLTITDVTDQPIIVHDVESDEDYDITDLIKRALSEITE